MPEQASSTRRRPVRKAVIPAAGQGTRMLPLTRAVPKELLPVVDRPVLQWVVDEARQSGIEEVIFVVSDRKPAIREHFADTDALARDLRQRGKDELAERVADIGRGVRFTWVTQTEQRGLGHAVLTAREAVGDEPFAVMLGDTIIAPDAGEPAGLAQLLAMHAQTGGSAVSVRTVPADQVHRYGIVDGEPIDEAQRTYRLHRLIEKPAPGEAPTRLAIAGRYVFAPTIFEHLGRVQPDAGGEIQLTDAMNALAGDDVTPMHAHRWRATRYDLGDPLDYLRCCVALGLADARIGATLRGLLKDIT